MDTQGNTQTCADTVLSCSITEARGHVQLRPSSAALVMLVATVASLHPCTLQLHHKASRCLESTQRTHTRSPGPGAQRACVPGLQGTITIAKTVPSSLQPSGHSTDSSRKHIPSLPVKKAYFLGLELLPEGQTSCLPHNPRLGR